VTNLRPDLVDLLPDAVIVLDRARRISAANDAACHLTGYARPELIGRTCPELLDARDGNGQPVWEDRWPAVAVLPSVKTLAEQKISLRRRDGSRVLAAVTGAYQRAPDGTIREAVLCLRQEPRRSTQSGAGSDIICTVSHELRAPLTSVKGYTSLLINRWDRLGDKAKLMMLQQVNHDAARVTRLITELLDISRLDSGRLKLHRQLVDIPQLATSVVAKVRLEYGALEARMEFPADFPKVYADPDKLEQVLVNLVENACKYGSTQGLLIAGAARQRSVSVSVTDRGEGIPPADVPRVFTKFYRRDAGRPTGSGLGLWISRGLVESHGGKLVAESNRGTGATFRFTLPLIDHPH
jgi:PAS domain S-box-containing protein